MIQRFNTTSSHIIGVYRSVPAPLDPAPSLVNAAAGAPGPELRSPIAFKPKTYLGGLQEASDLVGGEIEYRGQGS